MAILAVALGAPSPAAAQTAQGAPTAQPQGPLPPLPPSSDASSTATSSPAAPAQAPEAPAGAGASAGVAITPSNEPADPSDACDACDDDTCDACVAPDGRHRRRRRHGKPLERSGVVGVRASYLDLRGSDHPDRAASVAFAGATEEYGGGQLFTAHMAGFFALGGGSAGFDGALGLSFTGGIRAPVGEHHGPFVRIGAAGELQGNDLFYFSRLELPVGEVGWQYRDGRTVLELGGRGAPILAGRYNTGDATSRKLGAAFEYGGYASAHAWFGRVDVQATRIEARGPLDTPVDLVRGVACGYPWWPTVGVCFDLAYYVGRSTVDVLGPPPATIESDARTTYGGLMIGFGPF